MGRAVRVRVCARQGEEWRAGEGGEAEVQGTVGRELGQAMDSWMEGYGRTGQDRIG